MSHRSRVCHFVIDVDDLDQAVTFWGAALDATEEPIGPASRHVYRQLRLPDSNIRILLQHTSDPKAGKERMHLDLETDDVEAETARLVELGAVELSRWLDCRTLRVPGGQLVCVIPVHSDPDEFARAAHLWPSGSGPA